MCLLAVCEPNHTPKREELQTASCKNPHGFGYAIVAGATIISNRGMSARKMIDEFLRMREQYPGGYAMWHSRYATHGVKNEQNCHPYMVDGSDQIYLAHNGMLDIVPAQNDKRSDTRIFAEDWLPGIGIESLDNPYMMEFISSWAYGSKICILSVDPRLTYQMYLINENAGKWVDGVWWSNDGYKPAPIYVPTTTTTTITTSPAYQTDEDWWKKYDDYERDSSEEPMWVVCDSCQQETDLWTEDYYCIWCGCCLDCGSMWQECLCYPSKKPDPYKKGWVQW